MGIVKNAGEWTMGFCPSHADGAKHGGNGGHSLGLSKDGVLRCFAGCDFAAVMAGLRAHAGARPERPNGRPSASRRLDDGPWTQTAVYSYGIAEHVRLESPDPTSAKGHKKRFTWRISADDRRTLRAAGFTEADLPLYGLKSLEGIARERWINVGEGEKVVDALHTRNEPAVCAGGGASQKDFGRAWEALRGRAVRVFVDNDPPGMAYGSEVKRQCMAAGASKVVIMPPIAGPPGTDLVNHFEAGGTLEQLIADVLQEDAVGFVADDHVNVRLATEAGEIVFDMAEIAEGPRDLNCYLIVAWKSAVAERPYAQHINLLSASACEALARILGKHFKDAGLTWISVTNRAVSHAREAIGQIDISDFSEPDPDARPARLLLANPPIVEDGGTILSGLPKSGKSNTGLVVAVTLDAGVSDSALRLMAGPRRVLYVNLERSRSSMLARLARVNATLGLDPRRPLRFVHARGSGLSRILTRLRKVIRDHAIEFVVLDSISRGGFGNLNDNQVGNQWIDAMNSLGVSWLALGHTPRPSTDDGYQPHLFGTIMQDAGADAMVSLASKPGRAGTLLVSINTTAANDFARPPAMDLVYEFNDSGLVTVRRADDDEMADLEEVKTLSAKARILASLRDEGPATTVELAKRLKKQHPNISRDLKALEKDRLVRRDADKWSLTAEAYHPKSTDTYRDTGHSEEPVSTRVWGPLKGPHGGDTATQPDTTTCSRCKRTEIFLAAYSFDSTPENELPLCSACADETLSPSTFRAAVS